MTAFAHRRLLLLASVALTVTAVPVRAAEPAPAAAEEDSGVAEIVVTATKRETNLQDTPISISVLGGESLRERRVQSLLDLADGGVPSLRIATFEARQSALTIGIRGIVPLDANQPAREQGVGVYIDGVYLGRQHGLNAALFDVERIEVLKGPQGTLFGRNTEGGALSIVTRAPSGEYGGSLTGGVGNLGSWNVNAHLDLPEVAGFSIKLDSVFQHQDPVTRNPLPGQVGFGYFNRVGWRGAVRWQPFDGITNDFSYDRAVDKNTPFYSQLLNYNPNGCVATTAPQPVSADVIPGACVLPGTNFSGGLSGTVKPLLPGVVVEGNRLQRVADIGVPQQASVDRTFGYTNNFRWDVADAIELRSITAWRGVDVAQYDNSGGAHRVPVVTLTPSCTAAAPCTFSRYSLADLRQRQFSQELQAVGTIGRLDYVAGLYYFNERVSDDAATPNSMNAIATVANGQVVGATYTPRTRAQYCGLAAQPGIGVAVQNCAIDRASRVRSRSYAAYGQATLNVTDALHLTLGARYTIDKKEGELTFSRNLAYRDAAGNLTPAAIANGYTPLDQTFKRFNPLAIVAYDFSRDIHAYAKYATGYRAGGASSRTSNYQQFGPEDVDSYEVGLKTELFDRRVRFNIAAYLMDRTNSQVDLSTIQPTATGSFNNLVTFNAPGTTKIRGIEADVTVSPIENLSLSASYAYTYTKIPPVPVTYVPRNAAGQQTGPASVNLQNFYIVFTPRNAASGSIDYAIPFGDSDAAVKLHLDANYAQATQAFDQFATKADASFIVNGRISLADLAMPSGQKLTLSVWSRNLFNEQYVYRRDPSNSLPAVQTGNVTVGNINNVLGDYGNFNSTLR